MTTTTNTVLSTILLDTQGSGDCGVVLEACPVQGGYLLRWTDFVANDWEERYDRLPDAIARLAVLAECAASDWSKSFVNDAPEHSAAWKAFTSANLR